MARSARRPGLLTFLRDVLRVHLRAIPATALVVGVGMLAVAALLYGYAAIVGASYPALDSIVADPESATLALVLLMVPIAVIGILAALVWTGIVTHVASAAIGRREVTLGSAALTSLRRSPRVLLVGFLAVLLVALALAISPLFVIVGLLGLVVTPLLARSRFAERRPRLRTLVLLAIPLGVAIWAFVRTALATTSVWLAGSRVRAAFRDAADRSRGREVGMGLSLVVAAALTLGATQGLALLVGRLNLGPTADLFAQLVALIVAGPLVFVVLTVCYRQAGASSRAGRDITARRVARSHRRRGRRGDAPPRGHYGNTGPRPGGRLNRGVVPHPGGSRPGPCRPTHRPRCRST